MKLKQPIDKEVEFKWEYRDATGTRLQVGSDYVIPGAKFVKEYMATADRDYSMTFDHLYIKFWALQEHSPYIRIELCVNTPWIMRKFKPNYA